MVNVNRPTYWEWRAELEASRARWALATAGLGLATLALTVLLIWVTARPRPIYYIAAAQGMAWPGQVPDAVIEAFTLRVVTLLGTLTPATAKQSYEMAGRYLATPLLARLNTQARADLETIAAQRLGTSFTALETQIRPLGSGWGVVIRGTRQSWSGTQYLGEDSIRYDLEISRAPATDLNPWGLVIHTLRLEREPKTGISSPQTTREAASG